MQVSDQFHATVSNPPRKDPFYPVAKRLGGLQSWDGYGNEKSFWHCWKSKPWHPGSQLLRQSTYPKPHIVNFTHKQNLKTVTAYTKQIKFRQNCYSFITVMLLCRKYIQIYLLYIYMYTGCPRRKGPNFGRVFRYNPKHLYPKFNGYGDIGQRRVWTSLVSAYCTLSVTSYSSYPFDHNGMDPLYFSCIPTLSLDAAQ